MESTATCQVTIPVKYYPPANLGHLDSDVEGVFEVSFSDFSVRIFFKGQDYIVTIVNAFGDVVDTVKDPDLNEFFSDPMKMMREIHEHARRKAMGIDAAIDSILEDLDEDSS